MRFQSANDIISYQETLKRRQLETECQLAQRFVQAQKLAEEAAHLLKYEFGAERVAVFGSLAHGQWFSKTSDIDLAVCGLALDQYFTAVARLQDLSPEFKVDLVAVESCSTSLRQAILQEGQFL